MGTMDRAGVVVVWFRRDLRLNDNPALAEALKTGLSIVPVYVHDDLLEGRPIGGAARWWLDKSLQALDGSLRRKGSRLVLRRGDSAREIGRLVQETGAKALFYNRLYEPAADERDALIRDDLRAAGLRVEAFNGSYLHEPGTALTGQGKPYSVYTPFAKSLRPGLTGGPSRFAPPTLPAPDSWPDSADLKGWGLHPTRPDWSEGFDVWTPGEDGACDRLERFLEESLDRYHELRDVPGVDGTTRLSAHLHWGEFGPYQVLRAAERAALTGAAGQAAADKLIGELLWRDFNIHLLRFRPDMADRAWRPEYENFPFLRDETALRAWQRGQTGFPIVDAGMRQLWATGWMHNRVRMIAASFLIKDLLLDWREGERWFWDTLVDADWANNAASWQWVAGSGADAAPYFRVFNPTSQGEKFDPRGDYVRRWVPELAHMPDEFVHRPHEAPPLVLKAADVTLGGNYPLPVVEHSEARLRALDALKSLKTVAS